MIRLRNEGPYRMCAACADHNVRNRGGIDEGPYTGPQAAPAAPKPAAFTVDQVIAKYVAIRDQMKVISERHAAELKPYAESLDKIEAWLNAKLNEVGADSLKTSEGTAYRSTVQQFKLDDWDQFFSYIERSASWQFLVHSVNKTAVTEHMAEHQGALPPGVSMTQIHKVNVRRA